MHILATYPRYSSIFCCRQGAVPELNTLFRSEFRSANCEIQKIRDIVLLFTMWSMGRLSQRVHLGLNTKQIFTV